MKKLSTSEEYQYRRNNVFTREINGQTYMFDPKNGKIIELNETGTVIWNLLARERTIKDIALHLTACYDIRISVAKKDVSDFINTMLNSGYIYQR